MAIKGIVLAGGSGTRLSPLTAVLSKQLLPVYNKPMIYYPLSVLMLADIRDILVISTPEDTPRFSSLLGDGARFGLRLTYRVQPSPDGLAQAFLLGEEFIAGEACAMVLGDNIFYGAGLARILRDAAANARAGRATVLGYRVEDPERFGVMEFDGSGRVLSIEEKPDAPKSDFAVTGLYFYDHRTADMARKLRPSARGQLEITDLNNLYLDAGALDAQLLGPGFTWLDTGTFEALHDASSFVRTMEKRQGIQIAALEEIAYRKKWISLPQLSEAAARHGNSPYGLYLRNVAAGKDLPRASAERE